MKNPREFVNPLRLFAVAVAVFGLPAFAVPVTTQGTGTWDDPASWDPHVPTAGDDVTILSSHTITITNVGSKTVQSLTVEGTLEHVANGTSDASKRVSIVASAAVVISAGAAVNVNGKGYSGGGTRQNGYGPGKGYWNEWRPGGGGYGAQGGSAGGTGGTVYGSLSEPTDIGSGGGGSGPASGYSGGAGGGAVKIEAASATVNGTITANGALGGDGSSWAGAGGSGGSIWIAVTGALSGTGPIQANGAAGRSTDSGDSGGGGGGRIALCYGSITYEGTVQAKGGASNKGTGGAGTRYTKRDGESADLLIDNEITSGMVGTAGTWADNAVLSTLGTLTLEDYGILKHAAGTPLDIAVRTITVGTYASIDVSGLGAAGGGYRQNGSGTGKGYWNEWRPGGGGYGGAGGTALGAGGVTYGSEPEPTDLGSGGGGAGGGGTAFGGAGGGAVKLEARTFSLDGSILADGRKGTGNSTDWGGGGGSGGSIWLIATDITGTGMLRAIGGDGCTVTGVQGGSSGGGGGGRIAVYYRTHSLPDGTVTGGGGACPGGIGSLYYEYVPAAGAVFYIR